jgi:Flp pilus assembly protein TadB
MTRDIIEKITPRKAVRTAGMHQHCSRLFLMAALSVVVMYVLMYAMVG